MKLDGFIALLKADAGVSAVVADRVYEDVLPRNYKLPALVIHGYGGAQDYELPGPVNISERQIQIDAYGATPSDKRNALEAVDHLLTPFVGALPDGTYVSLCKMDRVIDMPFLPHADATGTGFRGLIGFTVYVPRA